MQLEAAAGAQYCPIQGAVNIVMPCVLMMQPFDAATSAVHSMLVEYCRLQVHLWYLCKGLEVEGELLHSLQQVCSF